MAAAQRICVISGNRADYGHLAPVIRALDAADGLERLLAVTGSHLSPAHGLTAREIEADGFRIDLRVDTLLAGDDAAAIGSAMGAGLAGFARELERLAPDAVLVLGDRTEILAAAAAALVARIPIVHLCGGDVTEGAYDDAIRHALTVLAALHFPSNAEAARRIRQMGEDPARIHVAGSPALDALRTMELLGPEEIAAELGIRLRPRNLAITYHPVTRQPGDSPRQLAELLAALDALGEDVGLWFTLPNADNEGATLRAAIERFAAEREHARAFDHLGHRRYLSLVRACDAVVGNSSSGLYEAPSLGRPTVNVGDRQRGRLRAASVVDCPPERAAIAAAIERARELDCAGVENPYGDGRAAERIVAVLQGVGDWRALLTKRFHDVATVEATA